MEISKFPLLTYREEIDLSKRIELGQQAQKKLVTTDDSSERLRLENEVADGLDAKNTLWGSNCRLVVAVARRHVRKGLPLDDLIEEGNLGLERATTRFDWRRGFRFSTYATWWINQAISRAISNQSRTIRVPIHTKEIMSHLLKASDKIQQNNGENPDIKQIAEYTNIPAGTVAETYRAYRSLISLDDLSEKYEGKRLADLVPGTDNVAEECEQTVLACELQEKLLHTLTARERMVLDLRYGLSDGNSRTLSEIGLRLGVTRERVRQIEAAALSKLRTASTRELFIDYLE